uniref:Uncharacterized protein n=1 Tax=viral metagenome TaxID=1070528 RepID=A0A6C0D047_9ZZZZ
MAEAEKVAAEKAEAEKAEAEKAEAEKAEAEKAKAEKAVAEKAAAQAAADVLHLIQKYDNEGWAQEEGKIYKEEMPDGRLPTIEAITGVELSGRELAGRIIMRNYDVHDADSQKKLKTLTDQDIYRLDEELCSRMDWQDEMNAAGWANLDSITLTQDVEDETLRIGAGEYKLLDSEKASSKFCDEPTCVLMSMLQYGYCHWGYYDDRPQKKARIMKYFNTRTMYQRKDEVNGNCDICHYCLALACC